MEIQRVDDISHQEFMTRFYEPGIPVVFKNASKVWKAKGLFSPDWFRENYGEKTTEKNGQIYSMKEIMDLVENSNENNPAPYPLIFNIPNQLPELLPLIDPLSLNYARPNWLESKWFKKGYWGSATELFIGGPGGKFPYLHLDYYHLNAWITQLYGEKRFTVFPRGQEDLLYPKPDDQWRSEVNIFEPNYEKHPKYKEATPIHFTVGPGETLFIPFGTWHSAYSLTPTISVAFDQLNYKNSKDFLKDVWSFKRREGLMKAVTMYSYAWLGCQMGDMLK
ncbi:MAG: cupin-like domain-containing protein [Pedobacter sp.]|uniref:cupin-like domain-containing protein n=1 Tax=Pedobacter sp. TaxID=1411316 RepID=UPI003563BEB6